MDQDPLPTHHISPSINQSVETAALQSEQSLDEDKELQAILDSVVESQVTMVILYVKFGPGYVVKVRPTWLCPKTTHYDDGE